MNKRGDIELRDFGTIFLIYILLITTIASSTNISISDNSSLSPPKEDPLTQPENATTKNNTTPPENKPENSTSLNPQLENQTNYSIQSDQTSNTTSQSSKHPNQSITNNSSIRIELIQFPAKVGEKVKWKKQAYTNDPSYEIQIPANAEKIPEHQILSTLEIKDYIEIEYETPAPQKIETNLPNGKEVLVYSEEHYENVSSSTQIDFNLKLEDKNLLKIYWKEENKYLDFEAFDSNNDGLINHIEWIIPHLSNQTFEIIVITAAQHLDENKTFIQDIYSEVKELDNIWSPTISGEEYVRITFEKNLTSINDITIFPKIISGNPTIEVYEFNKTEIIAEFTNIKNNTYNKIYLENLENPQDTFDLKIKNGNLSFDHIIDPNITTSLEIYRVQPMSISYKDNMKVGVTIYNPTASDIIISNVKDTWSIDLIIKNGSVTSCSPSCTENQEARTVTWDGDHTIPAESYKIFRYTSDLNKPPAGSYTNVTFSNNVSSYQVNNIYIDAASAIAYLTLSLGGVNFYEALGTLANDTAYNITAKLEEIGGVSSINPGQSVIIELPANWTEIGSNHSNVLISGNKIVYTVPTALKNGAQTFTFYAKTPATKGSQFFNSTLNGTDSIGQIHADLLELLAIITTDDILPPDPISNLEEINSGSDWIYWAWDSPTDEDFSESIIYLDGVNVANTSNAFYNATSLVPGFHTIKINTIDITGNINPTDINNTGQTGSLEIYRIQPNPIENDKNMKVGVVLYNPTASNITISNVNDTWGIDKIIKNANIVSCSPSCTLDENTESLTWDGDHIIPSNDFSIFTYTTKLDGVISGTFTNATFSSNDSIHITQNLSILDKSASAYLTISSDGTSFSEGIGTLAGSSNYNFTAKIEETTADRYIDASTQFVIINLPSEWTDITTSNPNVTISGNQAIYDIQSNIQNETAITNETFTFTATSPTVGDGWLFNATLNGTDQDGHSHNDIFELFVLTNTSDITPPGSVENLQATSAGTNWIYWSWDSPSDPDFLEDIIYIDNIWEINTTDEGYNKTGLTPNTSYNITIHTKDTYANINDTDVINITSTLPDNTAPLIDYTSPTENNNTNKSQDWIFLNVSVSEENEANITFILFNQTSQINQTTYSTPIRTINWTSLPDNTYYYNVTITDIANNQNSTKTRTIILDNINPNATLKTPQDNTHSSSTSQNLTVNATDETGLKNATLFVYNETGDLINQTTIQISGTQALIGIIYNFLTDGIYTWFYKIFDIAGNSFNTENNTITIDTVNPTTNILYPLTQNYNTNVSELNYSATDTNIDSCWYSLDQGSTNISLSCGQNASGLTSNQGTNIWTIYTNDSAGNNNSNSTTFFKDTIIPQIGYISPTENDNTNFSRNWIFLNVSATEANELNITFNLFNLTSQVDSTTYTTPIRTINWTSLPDNTYYYNVTIADIASNQNTTETRTITLDNTAPTITTSSPQATNISSSSILFNITSNELATICEYSLDGGTTNNSMSSTDSINWNATNSSMPDNQYTINYYCEDFSGNLGTSTIKFGVDTIHPALKLFSPQNSNYTTTSLWINFSISDINLDSCWYTDDGGTSNTTIPGCLNTSYTASQGSTTLNLYANDTAGNINDTEAVTFFTDSIDPIINFITPNTPTNNSYLSQNYLAINTSLTETNLANITYSLYNDTSGKTLINKTTYTSQVESINWTSLPDAVYFYNVSVYDTLGNYDVTETRTLILDTINPSAILTSISPNPAEFGLQNATINWTASDSNLGTARVQVINPEDTLIGTFFSNFTLTTTDLNLQGNYTIELFANDSAGNSNTTSNKLLVSDLTPPAITIISPLNSSGDPDGILNITFNVTDLASEISSCSLIIDGDIEEEDYSITKGIPQSIIPNLRDPIKESYQINCTDNSISPNTGSSETIVVSSIYMTGFTGETTNISELDVTDIANFTLDSPPNAKIKWLESVNLSSGSNLDSYITMSYNYISLDITSVSELNKSAEIWIYGVYYENEPVIMAGSTPCPATVCNLINYNSTTEIAHFNVTSFLPNISFTTANSKLIIWGETTYGMPFADTPKATNEQVLHFANYTNVSSGEVLSSATCNITILEDNSSAIMAFNATKGVFEYNRSYSEVGRHDFTIKCNQTGLETLTRSDYIDITPKVLYSGINIWANASDGSASGLSDIHGASDNTYVTLERYQDAYSTNYDISGHSGEITNITGNIRYYGSSPWNDLEAFYSTAGASPPTISDGNLPEGGNSASPLIYTKDFTNDAIWEFGTLGNIHIMADSQGSKKDNYYIDSIYLTVDYINFLPDIQEASATINETIVSTGASVRLNDVTATDPDGDGVDSVIFQVNNINYTANNFAGDSYELIMTCDSTQTYNWTKIFANDTYNAGYYADKSVDLNWSCDADGPNAPDISLQSFPEDSWLVGASAIIDCTDNGDIGLAGVDQNSYHYQYNSSIIPWTNISLCEETDSTCEWLLPSDQPDINVRCRVADIFEEYSSYSTASYLGIDNTGPNTTLDRPINFTAFSANNYLVNASSVDASSGVSTLFFEYRENNSVGWKSACQNSTSPYQCIWDLTTLPDASTYEFRARANDSLNNFGPYDTHKTIKVDRTGPITSIINPVNTTNISTSSYVITASASDTLSDTDSITIFYRENSTSSWNSICTNNTSPYQCTWDITNLTDGRYYEIKAYTNDTLGNSGDNDTKYNITLDKTPPNATLISPENNSYTNQSSQNLTINITENFDLTNATLFIYNEIGELINQTTIQISGIEALVGIVYNFITDGIYTWFYKIFDIAGNSFYTENSTITFDATNPSIEYSTGTAANYTNFSQNWIFINVSATETNEDNITFNLYNDEGIVYENIFYTQVREINWTSLSDDTYFYSVTIYDSAGNSNSTATRNITLDSTGPTVTIISPISKTYGTNESLPLNHTVTDIFSSVESCWWNIDQGANQSISCGSSTTFNTTVEPHTIYFFANDTLGNIGSDSVTFSISVTGPGIELFLPENNTFYNSTTLINFNFSAEDPDLVDTCSLYGDWNGGWHKNDSYTVFQEQESSTVFSASFSEEGSYKWNIKCNDTWGYDSFGLTNNTFTLDFTAPQVIFGLETEDNDTAIGRNWIYANVNLIENNFKNITFNLYNASGLVTSNFFSDDTREINWTNLLDGNYSYNATAYDEVNLAGHSETRVINIDTEAPSGTLETPINNTFTNNLSRNFTGTFTDASGLFKATLFIYNETGSIIHTSFVLLEGALEATFGIVYDFLQAGTYYWFYQIEDTLGNSYNTSNYTLNIDLTIPLIEFSTGTKSSGEILKQENIYANTTFSEDNFQNITFSLYNNEGSVYINTFYTPINEINWTSLSDNTYYYNVTIHDAAGNSNSTPTRNITLDNTAPTVDFISPTASNNSFITGDTIGLWANVTEENEANITFNLYNSTGYNVKTNTFTDETHQVSWNLMSDGIYLYNITVIDKVGQSASSSTRKITLDNTAPKIDYISPTENNNSYKNQNWINFKVNITEDNFQNVSLSLYNSSGLISTQTFTNTVREYNWTSLPSEEYYYNATTFDSAGNQNSTETRKITLDAVYPQIIFGANVESNNTLFKRDWIFLNASVTEDNEANITFSLSADTYPLNETTFTDSTRELNFTSLPTGVYQYNITILDIAGNSNQTETRTILIDTSSPSIQITNPQAKAYGYNESLPLTYTIIDNVAGADACWYNLDNGANTTTDCEGSTTFNTTDGTHTLHFFANDTLNNIGYKNVTFLISTTGPAIFLFAPEDNSFYSQETEIFFNYTAEDPDLTESCSLYGTWNGGWHLNKTDYNWLFSTPVNPIDNFENANFNNWSNVIWWTISSDQSIGTYSAKCEELKECYMDTNFSTDTSSALSLNLTFSYRDDDNDAGDIILYFNDSSGNWDNMGNIDAGTLGASDDNWNTHLVSTSDSQYLHPGFAVRFWGSPEVRENYWVDNIQINYDDRYNKPSGNFTLNLLEEGTHEWNVLCNDTLGYITSAATNLSITFDLTSPQVDFGLNTLPNNSNVSQNYIFVNSSIIESNFKNITFYLYNSSSLVESQWFNDTTRDYTFTGLSDKTYYYNFTVYDSAGRVNSTSTRTILLDTLAPTGNNNAPADNSYTNNATQNLTVALSDENGLVEAILYIYNSTGLVYNAIIPLSGALSATLGVVYEFLTDGIYDWFYQAEDIVGNLYNTTNFTLTIDTTLPQITFIPITLPDDDYTTQNYIYMNTSVIEDNFKNITFSLYNGEGIYDAYTFTNSKRDINYTLLPDDEYFYNVTVWDKANNINTSETRTITLDNLAPTINLIPSTEINYANKSQSWIYINTTFTETNFKNITFSLYNDEGIVFINTFYTPISEINWTSLSDDTYYYNVTIYDDAGHSSQTQTRTITLDTISPTLLFIAPTEDSGVELEQEYIYMNTSLTETNFKNITYFLYNETGTKINQTTYQTFVSETNFTTSSENKTYFYNATIYDIAGNKASTSTRNITLIDTTFPALTLNSPENKTYVYNTSLSIEYEVSDIHLDTCWYNLNDGQNITLPNCQDTTIDVADEQQHLLKLFTNDTMGYEVSENVTFFVNSSLIKIPERYSVQRGSIFTDGLSTPAISETHPLKAFIIHTVRGSDNSPSSLQVTSDFTDPEEIEFENYENGSGVLVEYSVICGPNITVQRGITSYNTEASINISINQVNLSNTFIILNNRLNSTDSSKNVDGFWTAEFTNDSSVSFTRGSNSAPGTLSYQVVSWEETIVQSASSTVSDTSTAQSISPTTLNKSFMVFSRRISGSTNVQDSMIKGEIKNSTSLEFNRVGSTGEVVLESFTIESEIFQSQNGTHTHSTVSTPQYDTIPNALINTTRSFDIHSNYNSGATTSFATAALTQNIHNETAIVLQKGVTTGAGETAWSAIEIIEIDPPVINLDYPNNTENFSTYTIPSFNFTISDESEIKNCSLYGNWSSGWHLNQTIQNPTKEITINFSSIALSEDNYYKWNIKCVDAYNNTGWASENFTFAAFLPPTVPTIYNITQTSNDGEGNITLSWNSSNHSLKYKIFTGDTVASLTYLAETTNLNYTDSSFSGNKRRFYQIQAWNPASQNNSDIYGAHLYTIKHDTIKTRNWIAFPSNISYLKTANNTLNEITNVTDVTMFNSTIQSRITCNAYSCPESPGCSATNCNFILEAGIGYEIDINLSAPQEINWSAVGEIYPAQNVDLIKNTTSFSKNWIAIYSNTTLTDAQGLIGTIPNSDMISKWDPETQKSQGLIPSPWGSGFIGNNFNLNLEEGYEVSVTASDTWTQQ